MIFYNHTKTTKFLTLNETISLIVLSFLTAFFDENKVWKNLVLHIRYKNFSDITRQLEYCTNPTIWSLDSLSKNTLFCNARKNIMEHYKTYLQNTCRESIPVMNFRDNKIHILMILIVTDTAPIILNVNTTHTSHQSLSYYSHVEFSYKDSHTVQHTIHCVFPIRELFSINDIITQNIYAKNDVYFKTPTHDFSISRRIGHTMVSNSKLFFTYFIKTHFLHYVSRNIKITVTITDDIFDKMDNLIEFSVNETQTFFATKYDIFLHSAQQTCRFHSIDIDIDNTH